VQADRGAVNILSGHGIKRLCDYLTSLPRRAALSFDRSGGETPARGLLRV